MILVSSEHAFPYRLWDPKVDFNLQNFLKNGYNIIYAGEIWPNDMYELLTTKWEIEPNLTLALINLYGGHIYDIAETLSCLYLKKERFRQYFDSNLNSNVIQILKWKFENENDSVY